MAANTAVDAVSRMSTVSSRLASLDILRGVVMVLMAIDHVRVYSGVPAGGPSAGVFFTRWVTHFCAPIFVFLAGTSAFLHVRKLGDKGALAKYLVTRGLMLVVLELTVIRTAWTFNVDYGGLVLAGVIWMLGWCMVLLAALIWLPTWAVGFVGFLIVTGQSLLPAIASASGASTQWLWQFLYLGGEVRFGETGPTITILYTLIPWIGVMALGYACGAVVVMESSARQRILLRLGVAATALFLVVGGVMLFTAAPSDDGMPALFRLLNQRKYPASPMFLLMTLGPAIALLPVADRARHGIADVLDTFGRVPLFYYLLHIPLIHTTALIVWYLRDGAFGAERFATAPYVFIQDPQQQWSLSLLYLVFAIDVAILYVACRWYMHLKATRPRAWMRYV
ncbi:MAG TPA: heparan-alpha-glucosaminide N-acetyltransferase domain-containing protein [Vicinamibacterales bacterium]|nr:heparan-alpha-glucosaminide N-acetyltransferase domain-containing protein [Vicinamibacterales bacterium]